MKPTVLVVLVIFLCALVACTAREDVRVEKAELNLEQAEATLVAANDSGDQVAIVAAEAAVEKAKLKLEQAEDAARKAREARQAFWLAVIGLGGMGIKALGGLAAKGAAI